MRGCSHCSNLHPRLDKKLEPFKQPVQCIFFLPTLPHNTRFESDVKFRSNPCEKLTNCCVDSFHINALKLVPRGITLCNKTVVFAQNRTYEMIHVLNCKYCPPASLPPLLLKSLLPNRTQIMWPTCHPFDVIQGQKYSKDTCKEKVEIIVLAQRELLMQPRLCDRSQLQQQSCCSVSLKF